MRFRWAVTAVVVLTLFTTPNIGLKIAACQDFPPFSFQDHGKLTGFDVEMWRLIKNKLASDSVLKIDESMFDFGTWSEVYSQVRAGNADFGVCCTFVTGERETEVNFPHPYLETGLRIATTSSAEQELSTAQVFQRFRDIFTYFTFFIGYVILVLVFIVAHALWLLERTKAHGGSFSSHYLRGIFQCLWFSVVTVTTVGYGDFVPKKFMSRFVTLLWMIIGLILYGVFLGSITSNLTVSNFSTNVIDLNSFRGRRIAVVQSTWAHYETQKILPDHDILPLDSEREVVDAVLHGKAAALVADSSVLVFDLKNETYGSNVLKPVGEEFGVSRCGMFGSLQANYTLYRQLNDAISQVLYRNAQEYEELKATFIAAELSLDADEYDQAFKTYAFGSGYVLMGLILASTTVGFLGSTLAIYRRELVALREEGRCLDGFFHRIAVKKTILKVSGQSKTIVAGYLKRKESASCHKGGGDTATQLTTDRLSRLEDQVQQALHVHSLALFSPCR